MQAAGVVRMGAGLHYDERVVKAFTSIYPSLESPETAETFDPESLLVSA